MIIILFSNWIKAKWDEFILWSTSVSFGLFLAVFLSFPKRARMSHDNGIAARGNVKIVDDPTFPPHDFFKPGKSFPCRIRHAAPTFFDDAMSLIRSFSIKFNDHYWDSPFDLEMNTGVINLFWSTASFLKFASMKKQKWGIEYHDFYRKYPQGVVGAKVSLRRNPSSYHNLRYQALTAFQFIGKDGFLRYAKYRTMPFDKQPETGIVEDISDWEVSNQRVLNNETRGRNYLKDEYKQRIAAEGAKYLIQIQLRLANDDDDPEIFNNMKPWDDIVYPWHDLAEVEIKEILSWEESLKTSFSLNNMPESLGIIPAKSIYDYNSLNYMRSHSEIARKARLLSYRVFGYHKEIPDDDNRNVYEWSGIE